MKLLNLLRLPLVILLAVFAQSIVAQVIINEIDSNQTGTDVAEFVELAGPAGMSLNGYVLVLINGTDDLPYECYDLDGMNIDANGFFVIGNNGFQSPGSPGVISNNWLQNGADAVALYQVADCASVPACPMGTAGLVSALVYDNANADDTGLLTCLGETMQINEDGNGNFEGESIQWDGTMWTLNNPTPASTNDQNVCAINSVFVSEAWCDGTDFNFVVNFNGVMTSGVYNIYDITNGMFISIGATTSPDTVTLVGNTMTAPFSFVISDSADPTCVSSNVAVTPYDCSLITNCPNPGDVIVSEIMHDPTNVSDLEGEWFEVYNTSANPVDLFGFVIRDADSDTHTITATVPIAAGGYAVIARSSDVLNNGGITPDYVISTGLSLASADEIILECEGLIIDSVYYSTALGFPTGAGESIALDPSVLDQTSNECGGNWCESTTALTSGDFGTPGAANDLCPSLCPTCPPDYTVANQLTGIENGMGGINGNGDYETNGIISSDQQITGGVVDYDSAVEIELLPNFEVVIGATFCAFIDGCNGIGGLVNPLNSNPNSLQKEADTISSESIIDPEKD